MRLKKVIFFILSIVIIAFLCVIYYHSINDIYKSNTNKIGIQTIKRLANNINCNWGVEVVGVNDNLINRIKYNVKIAVIDSGVNLNHESIKVGYNAIDKSADVSDNIGHGTSIASLLLDINSKACIIPVKVLDKEGDSLSPTFLKDALKWTMEQNVDIINISLGVKDEDSEIEQIIEDAKNKGVIIVAASGNYGGTSLTFPASSKNTISVVSRDIDNFDDPNSNKSSNKKSLSAPGAHLVTKEGKVVSGSSFAAAYVSGCIGIYKSIFKESNVDSITNVFYKTAVDGNEYSYGMIRLDRAIKIGK